MNPLEGLDEQQLSAARTLRGPVRILAGAGTGKTRVVTRRIAHGVSTGAYSVNQVMALTFTAKAAGEMRGRLRALGVAGVSARTFHSAALAQINYFWPKVSGGVAPGIVDNKVRLLAHAADLAGLQPETSVLRDLAGEIEWRKVSMRSIDQYRESGRTVAGLSTDDVVRVQRKYEDLKDERRQLDFEDVLLACAGMLESESGVLQRVRDQYRIFTVDEFQDVSPLQFRLLELWLGHGRDLCVVGDVSQTIYSFAGANADFLLGFDERFPDAVSVRLEKNYRSTAPILDVANVLMRGRPGALELRTERESPIRPLVSGYYDDEDEAEGVASAIQKQITQGAKPQEIAVLYRTHTQSIAITKALADRGIPTSVLGGKRYYDLPEVRQAIQAIRAAVVAPSATGFIGTVRDVLRSLGLTDEPPAAGGAVREAWESRAALLRLAEQAPPGTTVREFADELSARAADQHEPEMQTVTLATLHAAKGLEWPHVHLIGLSEGLLPISYAQSFEDVDEERRLAYVGITRAKTSLSLSWSQGKGRNARSKSRFLMEIGTRSLDEAGAVSTFGSGPRRR